MFNAATKLLEVNALIKEKELRKANEKKKRDQRHAQNPKDERNPIPETAHKSPEKVHKSPDKEQKSPLKELKSFEKETHLGHTFKQLMTSLDANTKILAQTVNFLRQAQHPVNEGTDRPVSKIQTHHLSEDDHRKDKRKEKMVVELRLTFMKITDIDTVTQQFEAEILVRAKWMEPLLSGKFDIAFDPQIMWCPNLLVLNLDGGFIIDKHCYKVVHNAPGYRAPLVVWLWRFKGFFKENLELAHFPIDVQDLTISLTTERSDEEVDLIEDNSSLSGVNTGTFMDAQEWDIYTHVETYEGKTTLEYASDETHPIFYVQCRVKRKVGYFLWNIVFIVSLITVLTFTTFSIEPSSADRLGVTITLLLTSVTFKLIVKQSLPTISYLTYLDLYVIAALVFLGLTSAQHAIIRYMFNIYTKDQITKYDNYSIITLLCIFLAFHVIFGVYMRQTAIKRRTIMVEKDKLYKAKRKFIDHFGENARTERVIEMSMSKTRGGTRI
ncbi:gamma-aminobutyric acid receptor subunit beta-1-like [Mytilus californianus]|uniref:gamma-aminobutyric acid receptor subunit beta-1-like n=1 Tax=Mytilus californianus TaxID=6549 RepID=UPI00224713BE|nr:gamma-aminobutyric acid receptor subunit beta-1-like [Mytilus californianus]